MITFWLIAAVFVAIALAFVLPPLLQRTANDSTAGDKETNVAVYRDQLAELDADLQTGIISAEQHRQDRDEIERRLLSDVAAPAEPAGKNPKPAPAGRGTVYALALGLPIVAIAGYYLVGTPGVLSTPGVASPLSSRSAQAPFVGSQQPSQASPSGADGPMTQERMEANIAALAKRLEQNPDDVNGWKMLARSYSIMEKYADASNAYRRATELKADDADLWADYALAKTMASGQQMQGEPMELVNRALKIDPENPKALQLAGGAAFQAKRYREAVAYWERVLKKLPPDSELTQALKLKIDEAKSLASK
ncbi:MAG: c-type cytochrome biogenesis protein CcmI [Pyrinomonadaceae bacterium]|nr:c-type cytochrome biogenesis protein CcmI [Pyrinomonadaceae bacterium]